MNRDKFFGEAYEKGFGRTFALLRRRGANPDLAQELAQAAWAKAWQYLLQLRDDGRILQFVNTIAIRLLVDELSRSRRMTALNSVAADLKISPTANVAAIDLQRALWKCPPRQRALLETVYLEERNATEVAGDLGTSVSSLHQRLSTARRSLRKHGRGLADARQGGA